LNNDQVYLSVLVGQSAESFTSSNFSASNEGYLTNDFFELNAGSTNPSVSGTSAENKLASYFGRVNLVFKDKYLLEINSRYDGSSRFAKGNRWGFFPSFSAGWRLDQENFLADVSWLSELKLRGSWGQLGNERIGNFQFADFIDPGQDYGFGGVVNTGTAVRVDNDDQISWETTTISNIALDAGFFNGKLNASVEYFDKTTDGVLRPVGIPSQVGNLGGPTRNIGSISNKGVELNLGVQDRKGDFGYQLSGNVTYLQNEVTNLNGEVIINDFSIDRRGPLNITQEGAPINQYYLFQSDGYFQNQAEIDAHPSQGPDTRPGFIRFKDINDDGVIDNDDRVATGNVIPEFTYTFNINFSYKNWSLNSFWQGVEGVDTYNKHVSGVPFWFGTGVPTDWANDSWTPDNPDASLPILMRYQDGVSTQFRYSDFWLLDASYLRLKNLQLRYDFGSRVLDALGLQELVLYANAQNLLTITDLEDFDPETRLLGGNFFNYPSARTYTFGVNVTF
jgi:TonB-linked SusC/RagA family outer membrane protein